MSNLNMFTGQMQGSTMMTPMSRPSMPPQQPCTSYGAGGVVPRRTDIYGQTIFWRISS